MPLVLSGTDGVSGVDGTASNPSLEGTDSNTGVFFPAADTVAIGTGGTERLRVDSAGNAGLGVTPSAWLNTTKVMQFGQSAVLFGRTASNQVQFGSNFYIDTSAVTKYINTDYASKYVQDSGQHQFFTAASGTGGTAIGTFTQAMTLDASGNLGVGTSSPAVRLHLSTATTGNVTAQQWTDGSTDTGYLGIRSGGGVGIWAGGFLAFGSGSGTFTERARITSGGSLIVGGTSVSFAGAMSEFQQSSGDCVVSINRTGTLSNGQQASIYAIGGSRQAATFVYKHSGITNSCGALNVQCEDAEQNYLWADNSDVLRISTNAANIGTTGGTVVGTQTSDERLKNISGAISYGLTEVMALQPIAFAMKDDPETAKIGFSAQQVQPIIPESVYDTGECIDGYDVDPENKLITTPKSDRTKLAMEYTQLIPVLTKAIQELNAKVEAQAAEIAALKGNA